MCGETHGLSVCVRERELVLQTSKNGAFWWVVVSQTSCVEIPGFNHSLQTYPKYDRNLPFFFSIKLFLVCSFVLFFPLKVVLNVTFPRISRVQPSLDERIFPTQPGVTAVYSVSSYIYISTSDAVECIRKKAH